LKELEKLQYAVGMELFMELSNPKDRSERLAFRTRSRRVDEAAFERHAD
jgi:hypothetical protein